MKKISTTLLFAFFATGGYAQGVGIGTTPNPSAMLDVSSTSRGLLAPRLALTGSTDATTISNGNVTSLLVYNTATASDVIPGYYYWNGTAWVGLENTDQQDLSYDATTNVLSLSNAATSVTLSDLIDHDWYEVGTTVPANDIGDDIYTQGNVGIASTNPSTKLQIGNSPAGTYRSWMDYGVLIGDDTDGVFIGLKDEGSDNEDAIIAWGDNANDDLRFLYNGSGQTTSADIMTLQPNGNIGIGTTTPATKLDVNGQIIQGPNTTWGEQLKIGINATLTTVPEATVGTTNGNLHLEAKTGFDTYINHYSAGGNTYIGTGNNTGNVGIGTVNASSKLTVNGVLEINKIADVSTIYFTNSASEPGYIRHSGNLNSAEMRFVASDDFDAGSAGDKFTFGGETGSVFTEAFRIQGNGNVGIKTANPSQRLHVIGNILASGTVTSSDERYKEGIQNLKNSTALLASIRPVAYNFRTAEFPEGQFDDKLHYGIIAQELETVLPNLVYTDLEGYKGINYTELIPLLIKSNQEQQTLIETQQKQINQLIDAVKALKK